MNNFSKPRSRGRPPKTENDQEQIKNHIAQAAVRAFAEHGYHRMNVEHILFHADVSRPTFYKYFRQIEEPLVLGMMPYSQSLIQQLKTALDKIDDPIINAVSAFEVYVNWAKGLGTIMAPVYAEFYDASSPIAAFRLEVVNILLKLIKQKLLETGRPVPFHKSYSNLPKIDLMLISCFTELVSRFVLPLNARAKLSTSCHR